MDFSGSIFGGFPVIGDGLDRGFCNVLCPWWKWRLVLDSWRRVGFMCPFSYGLIGVWFCFLGLEDVKERFFFFQSRFCGFDWTWDTVLILCEFHGKLCKLIDMNS